MNFNEIIKKNVKNIIRIIAGEDNEDLEQEVYLKVWKNSDKYKEKGCFKSWVNTIAKNVTRDYLKSSVRKHEQLTVEDDSTFDNLKDSKASPELRLISTDRKKRIMEAINQLKPKCSKKLKCPVGTVKSRIYNAKKELAEQLHDLL